MDIKETVLDKITKSLGNYLSTYANKNILNELCDEVEVIYKVIDNIKETKSLIEKEDPKTAATLGSFILKKEKEAERILSSKIPELFPKPEIIYADDYDLHYGESSYPDYFVLKKKNKDKKTNNTKLSAALSAAVNVSEDPSNDLSTKDVKPAKKKTKSSTKYSSCYSSGGCGSSSNYSSGGCGGSSSNYYSSGGCGYSNSSSRYGGC